jgi:hypothetical protein
MVATSKIRPRKHQKHRAKRQNVRIKSRTVSVRTRRATAQRAEQIPQETRKIGSPSIVPEIQQTEPMETTKSMKSERYMVNEAEYIRLFGWWGLH